MAPHSEDVAPAIVATTTAHLKIVDKLDSLPVVLDVVNVATKLHEQALTYPIVTKVEDVLMDGIKVATPILEDNVFPNVPEGVKTTMATAVDQLDTLACHGLDQLTTNIPLLTETTGEIVKTTTEATITMANTVTDYLASFQIVQAGLKMTDTGLAYTEKALTTLEPSLPTVLQPYVAPTVTKIEQVRRYLRAIRHAGRKLAGPDIGAGWLIDMFHINFFLSFVGISLVPITTLTTTETKEAVVMDTNDEETTLEKLSDEKMAEYDSSQDADYVPELSQESLDIDYNSQAEVSQEESQEVVTEESTQEESQETEP
jgi:hypothetical protein